MAGIRIIADDLTGALDAAGAFADRLRPMTVLLPGAAAPWPEDIAVDTETRDVPESEAAARVARVAPRLAGADRAYKKIDSLLRGHAMAETAALMRAGGFRSLVVAPGFPEQRRITCAGRQWWCDPGSGTWRPSETDLIDALARHGIRARRIRPPVRPSGADALVCDVTATDHLDRIAAAGPELAEPVLWCGAAGLAGALARVDASNAPEPTAERDLGPSAHGIGATLAICGSVAPAAVAQMRVAAERWPGIVLTPAPGSGPDAIARTVAARRNGGGRALIVDMTAGMAGDATTTRAAIADRLAALAGSVPAPERLVIMGGATLHDLSVALGATRLVVERTLQAGIPVSRFGDGAWAGVEVVSKSGGFGDPAFLIRQFELEEDGNDD
ncbi:MAG: four-carbon acid sugar kinase family protein [Azospirillaceae bacterium]